MIGEELQFRTGQLDGEPTFIWRDLDGDIDEFYEYLATGTNEPTRAFFETCMYRAMYERKHKRGAENTQDKDLEEFVYRFAVRSYRVSAWLSMMLSPPPKAKPASRKKVPKRPNVVPDPTPEPEAPPPTVTVQENNEPTEMMEVVQHEGPKLPPHQVISTHQAELYYWDSDQGFQPQGPITGQVIQIEASTFEYWLVVTNDSGGILAHQITSEMNPRWSQKMFSLTWNHFGDDNASRSCLLHFADQNEYQRIMEIFSRCLWEYLHQEEWRKAKVR